MKKKILIVAAAALVTLGIATVSAQSPVQVKMSENFVLSVVEAPRYGAAGASVDENGNVTLDVELCLEGDVNMDGVVDIGDHQRLFEYLQGLGDIEDDYQTAIANVNGDSSVDIGDHQRLFEHLQGLDPLY